jgi:hypothetical protein
MRPAKTCLEVIEVRFGQVPEAVKTKVNATSDLALLKHWLRVAAEAKDIHAIEKAVTG